MVKDLIFRYGLPDIEGMTFRSSLVKALPNCSLRIVDFSFGYLWDMPSLLSTETPPTLTPLPIYERVQSHSDGSFQNHVVDVAIVKVVKVSKYASSKSK